MEAANENVPLKEVKEVVSTPTHLKLMEFKPEAFGGIRPDMNFVFSLDGGPIAGFVGDQGLGKTSVINCLIMLMGGEEAANSMNISIEAGKRKANRTASLTFKDIRNANITYEVKATTKSFAVKKIELTEGGSKPVTSSIDSPKTWLRDLFGPIGVSPMILKEKDGKGQIEWIRSLYKFTQAQLVQEKEMKDSLKAKGTARTAINKDIKRLYSEVTNTGYYTWDEENLCFVMSTKKAVDEKNVKENLKDEEVLLQQMKDAQEKIKKRDLGIQTMDKLLLLKTTTEKEITELERQLVEKKQLLLETTGRIENGLEFNKQFDDAQAEFDKAQNDMMNLGELKIMKSKISEAEAKEKEYEQKVADKINVTAAMDKIKLLKKQFVDLFTPKIEGLKLIIDEGIDKTNQDEEEDKKDDPDRDLPEGLYYKGRSMQELSESELWAFFMMICKELGVHFLFIENAQSLGSDAAQTINWFVQNGFGQVFYTAMMRGQKELQFTINGEFN